MMVSCLIKVLSSRMCDVGRHRAGTTASLHADTSAADAKPPLQRAPVAGTIIGPGPWTKWRTRHSNRFGRSGRMACNACATNGPVQQLPVQTLKERRVGDLDQDFQANMALANANETFSSWESFKQAKATELEYLQQ